MHTVSISQKEQLMRDYWLGSLSADQVETLENQWLDTDEDAEMLNAMRDDLIADYLSSNLSAGEKHLFEKNFLAVPANSRDTAIAKSYRKLLDEKSVRAFAGNDEVKINSVSSNGFWIKISSLFDTSLPQLTLAAMTVLILIFGGLLAFQFLKKAPEQAKTELSSTPATVATPEAIQSPEVPSVSNQSVGNAMPSTAPTSADRQQQNSNNGKKNEPLIKPPPSETAPKQNPIMTLALVVALRDSQASTPILKLSKETQKVRLQFLMPALTEEYTVFEARVLSGDKVISHQNLPNLNIKQRGENLTVEIPAGAFRNGDYQLQLVAKSADAKEETLSRFGFRVQQK